MRARNNDLLAVHELGSVLGALAMLCYPHQHCAKIQLLVSAPLTTFYGRITRMFLIGNRHPTFVPRQGNSVLS